MKKNFKKILSLVLATVIVISLFTVISFSSSAKTYYEITEGEYKNITLEYDGLEGYVSAVFFTPFVSGTYEFSVDGEYDTYFSVDVSDNAYGDEIASRGNYGTDENITFTCYLNADTEYYIDLYSETETLNLYVALDSSDNSDDDDSDVEYDFKSGDFSYVYIDDNEVSVYKYYGSSSNVTIPSNVNGNRVTAIKNLAFYNKTFITNVNIPDSITSIGRYAFENCSSLYSITIPASVTEIGDYAIGAYDEYNDEDYSDYYRSNFTIYGYNGSTAQQYANSHGLSFVNLSPAQTTQAPTKAPTQATTKAPTQSSQTQSTPDYSTEYTSGYYSYRFVNTNRIAITDYFGTTSTLTIPSSINGYTVVSIDEKAFAYNNYLNELIIPDSIIEIADEAFRECEYLTTLKCGKNLKTIGDLAFFRCDSLKNISLNNGLETIGYSAFENIGNTTEITIPKSVKTIGECAFGYIYISDDEVDDWGVDSSGDYSWKNYTIKGYRGTASETYALRNDFKFTDITIYQQAQSISVKSSYTKTFGATAFNLNAKAKTKLTYSSNNTKVVTVSSSGKVNVKGCGKATITVKAASSTYYKAASKSITVIVKPGQVVISKRKVKSGKLNLKFKQQKNCDGYKVQISTKKSFKKKYTASKTLAGYAKGVKVTVQSGAHYYVRIRAYKKIGGKKYNGKWRKTSFYA